ncbi:unnamed protein product [Kuraishia capsulata CBS 1993]|uniref:FAR1 domain-containing protein n=1 Tax=Kuraishia capsulata CBS 1993 TaxID=1382522 RepID=W6MNK3_9ASCO|nr:uncharacterized protein KUCA_T00002600001 [Kuraishia capsulata CBS 1993]CDK26627.1 unnamed protein product [Kuraishia capsulata CBS 1993]
MSSHQDMNIDVEIINQGKFDDSAESKIQQIIPKYTSGNPGDLSHLNIPNFKSDEVAAAAQALGHQGLDHDSELFVTPQMPEQTFEDVVELKEWVKAFAKKNEFGIAIAHSNNKAIYFTCELGGVYREKRSKKSDNEEDLSAAQQQKKIGSKKISCQFSMVANFSKKTNNWTLKMTENNHNHPKLDPLTNFPMLRKRTPQVNNTIKELYSQGDKPSIIHAKLTSAFPDLMIKREDIYNEIRILKKRRMVPTNNEIKKLKMNDYGTNNNMETLSHHMSHQEQLWSGDHVKLTEFANVTVQEQQKKDEAEAAAAAVAAAASNLMKDDDKIDENLMNIDSRLVDN